MKYLGHEQAARHDLPNPMCTVFPTVTRSVAFTPQPQLHLQHHQHRLTATLALSYLSYPSCTFHSVGTAAGEQKFNSLCILSLNIVNEKVFSSQKVSSAIPLIFLICLLFPFPPPPSGVPVPLVLVLWPDHPHRAPPGLPAHLHHHPAPQVAALSLIVV